MSNGINYTYPSAYDGRCGTCGERYGEDDEIGYLPGERTPSCVECLVEFGEE